VLNSLASGRRLALRIVLLQLAVAVIVGLAFLTQGLRDAIAAAAGAAIVALGTALLAARAFAGLGSGGVTVGRMLTGMVLKWIAIGGGLIMIMGQFKLPPLAAITGLVAAYAINLLAFRFKG
jgi:type IV secretory pathway TrbL component